MIPRFIRRRLQRAAMNHGVQITQHRYDLDSSFISKKYERRLLHSTADCLDKFLNRQKVFPLNQSLDSFELTQSFYNLYKLKPNKGYVGSTGFNSLLCLYSWARHLEPELIIESGVFVGQSTWCLRNAAPGARIESFDIDLTHLQYRNPTINFHEFDWSDFELLDFDPARAIIFFDDHVDQVRRLLECYERGFRYICFDDNTPVEWLHLAGNGAPMLDFLFYEGFEDGETIKWEMAGTRYQYTVDSAYLRKGRQVIEDYAKFPVPALAENNGLSNGVPLTVLRLKRKNV